MVQADMASDPVAVIGSSCRLPGAVEKTDDLWSLLEDGRWAECSTPAPPTRGFQPNPTSYINRGGWLPRNGVEDFDASFFKISPGEAQTLRPNIRLALELTWEALENAGILPSQLKGKNVSVSIAMGAEDGWDMRRFAEDGEEAFDHNWAQNSDPSAVAGRVAHFFDFHGAIGTISGACASGANALDYGIHSLASQEADIAIVGAIATHFSPAAFAWASSVRVASKSGRCSAFSLDADGYVPSEGAVFLVLKRSSRAIEDGDCMDGIIRSLTMRHNGNTQTLASPSASAQASLIRDALRTAGVDQDQVVLHEAHGTGTILGDMIEMEAIRNVFNEEQEQPLYVSSSKTVLGHCQAAAALVGILKVLLCFKHRRIPPHHVEPYAELREGRVLVPTTNVTVDANRRFIATVSSFGFTGGIAHIVLEEPPERKAVGILTLPRYLIPFSAKTDEALQDWMESVHSWVKTSKCTIGEVAATLSLAREHHPVRKAVIVSDKHDLEEFLTHATPLPASEDPLPESLMSLLNLDAVPDLTFLDDDICANLRNHISSNLVFEAAAILYENGHDLHFLSIYEDAAISPIILRSFPTYPFQRRCWWRSSDSAIFTRTHKLQGDGGRSVPNSSIVHHVRKEPTISNISEAVCAVLNRESTVLDATANIFDLGINSLNSIELAKLLSTNFPRQIGAVDLYGLLTIQAVCDFFSKSSDAVSPYSQAQLDAYIEEFSTPLDCRTVTKESNPTQRDTVSILLTGATGFLGAQILRRLLSLPSVKVFCLVRGDPIARLRATWKSKGLGLSVLERAILEGALQVVSTSDLGHDFLGCSQAEYENLLNSVDAIIHCAWKVDFNFHLSGFRSDLITTRSLAQLCASSNKLVALHFITSFSTSFGYEGRLVPEAPLDPKVEYALTQGYAMSKMAAEHVLYRLLNQQPGQFLLRVLRVGQICGHSMTGDWTMDEMIPMILSSMSTLRMVPEALPDVSWIPMDVCGDTIGDVVLGDISEARESLVVYNLANPTITPWRTVVSQAAQAADCVAPRLVALEEYIQAIEESQRTRDSSSADVPVSRLLSSFMSHVALGGFPSKYCQLDVSRTTSVSTSLTACPAVDQTFVTLLMKTLLKASAVAAQTAVDPVKGVITDTTGTKRYAMLFGPLSGTEVDACSDHGYLEIVGRLETYAAEACPEFYIEPELQEHSSNNMVYVLRLQLHTLASQLYHVQRLAQNGIHPSAVSGYCFGEFAAAVTSGYASEQEVTEIIARRALAVAAFRSHSSNMDKENRKSGEVVQQMRSRRGRNGAMLNVFASIQVVRRNLAVVSPAPEIAIHAGPSHIVLTGSVEAVEQFEVHLKSRNIMCKRVDTSIPFHSSQMDEPLRLLARMLQTGAGRKSSNSGRRHSGDCLYISGLTGKEIPGHLLGPKYWLRHMREPVRFFESVQTMREMCRSGSGGQAEWTIVDVGPGATLTSIVGRYGWEDFPVVGVERCLEGRTAVKGIFLRLEKNTRTPGSVQNSWLQSSPNPTSISRAALSDVTNLSPTSTLFEDPHPRRTFNAGLLHKHESSRSSSKTELETTCLSILSALFHYSTDTHESLLQETFQSLGMDSLSFVRLSSELKDRVGTTFKPSAYTSDTSLEELLNNL